MKFIRACVLPLLFFLASCQGAPAQTGELPTLASLGDQAQATPTPEAAAEVNVGVASAETGTTETREVGAFSAIAQNLGADLTITSGSTPALEITADAAVLPLIQSTVTNDVLDLRVPDGTTLDNAAISIRATMPALRALTINGAGTVNVSPFVVDALQVDVNGAANVTFQPLTAQSLTLNLAGQGSISFDSLTVIALTANVSGSGIISALGDADTLTVTAPGGGELRAAELFTRAATIDIAGSLAAAVNVAQQLDVAIVGSGSVTFNGSPQVNANVTGGGRVVDSAGNVVAGQ